MIIKRRPLRRISWGSIFAGVIVALVVQLLLSLLGLAIGLGSINPMTETDPFSGLGTGALVWWVASMLIALFAGGLAAGRLSGLTVPFDRVLHGFLTFSVYSIVSFFMITTAVGGIISGVGSLVGKSLSYTGQDQNIRNRAENMAETFRQRAGGSSPEDTLRKYEPEIRSAGQDAASTASKVSLFAFIGLVLGAAAASAGSGVGRPKKEVTEVDTEDTYDDTDIRRDTYIKRDPDVRRENDIRTDADYRRDVDIRRDPDIRRDTNIRRDANIRRDPDDIRRDDDIRRRDDDIRRDPDERL